MLNEKDKDKCVHINEKVISNQQTNADAQKH